MNQSLDSLIKENFDFLADFLIFFALITDKLVSEYEKKPSLSQLTGVLYLLNTISPQKKEDIMKQPATLRPLGLLAALLLMLLVPATLAYGANEFVPIENMGNVNRTTSTGHTAPRSPSTMASLSSGVQNKVDSRMEAKSQSQKALAMPIQVYNNDFEGAVGSEWSNTSTDVTPVGGRKFLGQFSNETVALTLTNLPSHEKVTVSFDLFMIRSWDGHGLMSGPDIWDLSVENGPTLLHTTFSNTGYLGNRQAYPQTYPGGENPSRTGAAENSTLGYSFDSIYRLSYTFLHSESSLTLNFSASGLQALLDESWGLDNVDVSVATSTLTAITPDSAVANAGNVPVIISGSDLGEPVTARIGNVDLLSVTLESANTLHAVVPVGSLSEGTYDLTVESAGQTVTLTDTFTVKPAVAPTQFLAMVYLACDNNLAASCRRLFNNLELAMTNNPNLRIAAFWDGKAHGDSAYYLVQPDDNPYTWASYDESNHVSLGEMDSADPGTLVQFAAWAQSQYPGEYNFLSLVDHGSGWAPDLYPSQKGYKWSGGVGGMFWDDTSHNVMSTQALASALDWISDGNALDALYLDACQMGTVEVIAELAPYAQYVIAHENLAWATYPYDQYFNGMDGSSTPSALAQQIAQVNKESWPEKGHPTHIAVVNNSQMDNALSQLDALANQLLSALPDDQVRLAIDEVVRNTAHIDENTDFRINGEDSSIDLYHFASQLQAHAGIPDEVKTAAQALMSALDDTIEANYTHSDTPWPGTEAWDLSNLHGLSVYFPLADEWKRAFYGPQGLPRFANSTAWDDFIQAWHGGTQQQRAAAPEPPTESCPECLIAPMHTALTIGEPESAIVGELVWVPVWLSGVETEDDVRGVQISVQVTDTNMLLPADDLQPRLGEFFPEDSYTYAVHSSNGKGWDYILTDVGDFESQAVSGEGIIVELPFYAQAEGCVYVEFKTHLLGNHQAEEVNHYSAGNWVCTNDRGTLTGRAFLQSRNPGAYDQVRVTITGPRETYTTTTDVDGNYTFLNIYQDEYEMTFTHIASVPLFAQRSVSNVSVNAGGTTTLDVGLWAGDIDQDGDVDRDDEKLLEAATIPVDFRSFDINANGETNVFDLIILQHNKARPNLSSTNPPQGRAGTVAGRAADTNSVAHNVVTNDRARQVRLAANGNTEVAYTLRAEVTTGTIESIGTRLALPTGATVTDIELAPAFAGGNLFWEQEEDKLYIVAAPDLVLTEDNDVLTIRMNVADGEVTVTVEAVNKVGWDGELIVPEGSEVQDETNVLYLPMMTR